LIHRGLPDDEGVRREYVEGPYAGWEERCMKGNEAMCPEDADPEEVARAVVRVVEMKKGSRPFRVYVEPAGDGGEEVRVALEKCRRGFLGKLGCEELINVVRS
jgi:hypothetical protein